jgi:hypothetical protein
VRYHVEVGHWRKLVLSFQIKYTNVRSGRPPCPEWKRKQSAAVSVISGRSASEHLQWPTPGACTAGRGRAHQHQCRAMSQSSSRTLWMQADKSARDGNMRLTILFSPSPGFHAGSGVCTKTGPAAALNAGRALSTSACQQWYRFQDLPLNGGRFDMAMLVDVSFRSEWESPPVDQVLLLPPSRQVVVLVDNRRLSMKLCQKSQWAC